MKRYHIATGDGKAYYGVNYESFCEAEVVLKFSQKHDPKAHIVEEEYHFTNADRILTSLEMLRFMLKTHLIAQYLRLRYCDLSGGSRPSPTNGAVVIGPLNNHLVVLGEVFASQK